MSTAFVVGDKVICIDAGDTSLIRGHVYEITRGGDQIVKVEGAVSYQYAYRFKKVEFSYLPKERLVVETTVRREMWSEHDQIWVPQQTTKTSTIEEVKR